MPSLTKSISYSSSTDRLLSAASTLITFFWASVARVRGKTMPEITSLEKPPFTLEGSMLRKPTAELPATSFLVERKMHRPAATNLWTMTYNTNDKTIPQRLVDNSLPIVHHSLPDQNLWNKIDEKLELQEKLLKKSKVGKNSEKKNLKLKTSSENLKDIKLRRGLRRSRRNAPQLERALRRRQLYCRNGVHVQIMADKRIKGTSKDHDKNAILEFISTDVGRVIIRGVESGKYLSMDRRGRLYGSDKITKESIFKETFLENWYNTYSSTLYRNKLKTGPCYLAFSKNGKPKHGCRSNPHSKYTHFIPRPVNPEKVPELYKGILY